MAAAAVAAVAAGVFVMGGDEKGGGGAERADVLPTVYTPSMADRDTARLGRRSVDPRPLTEGEVFTPALKTVSYRSLVLTLADSDVSADCKAVTWGERFQADLDQHGCNQIVRGSYVSRDKRHVGQFAAVNLADQAGAEQVVRDLNPAAEAGFVRPLPAPGMGPFGRGFSAAYAQAYGHYVVVAWVQRAGGAQPASLNEMIDVSLAVEKPGDFVWGRLQLLPDAGRTN
ncbi:hypothetical protein [Thermomonospora umbrina]|uniref:hypothetical protein n=1 Tax=Thermomonospora umbrina TaxID=111806 RepID=UPI0011C1D0F8|nr:hypothetical protein [Thermomonospora umbrina]